MSVNHNKKPNN